MTLPEDADIKSEKDEPLARVPEWLAATYVPEFVSATGYPALRS